jgi:hypothetical protein
MPGRHPRRFARSVAMRLNSDLRDRPSNLPRGVSFPLGRDSRTGFGHMAGDWAPFLDRFGRGLG